MSSAKSASVRWTARQRLPLCQWSVIPTLSSLAIAILMTKSKMMMNRYSANVSPCRTPATIGKKFVAIFSNHGHGVNIQSFDALDYLGWTPIGKQHIKHFVSMDRIKSFLEVYKGEYDR